MASTKHWVVLARVQVVSERNLVRRCDLDGMHSRSKAIEEEVVVRNDLRCR